MVDEQAIVHETAEKDHKEIVKMEKEYSESIRKLRSDLYFLVSISLQDDTEFADVEDTLDNISNDIYAITNVFKEAMYTADLYTSLVSSLTEESKE